MFRVEGQPGEDLYPGGDPIEVVRQFGYFSEQPHPLIVASGQEVIAVGAEGHGTSRALGCGMGGPRGIPEAASQSRTFPSWPPVSTIVPSGLNATAMTRALMQERSRAECPCLDVPEPRPAILAAGEDGLAIRAERHRSDVNKDARRAGQAAFSSPGPTPVPSQ